MIEYWNDYKCSFGPLKEASIYDDRLIADRVASRLYDLEEGFDIVVEPYAGAEP
jgi:hypothetical protein